MAARADDEDGIRIAVWSGPRNISTALLRSWGNRDDTFACDEPLYGHYLHVRRVDHPDPEAVIAAQGTDWRRVTAWLAGPVPGGKRIFYQKHMAHHLLPGMEGDWLDRLRHGFLIREPEEMLTSLVRVMPEPTLPDTGLPQQLGLFQRVREREGRVPPVIDARDVLRDPEGTLRLLCRALEVPFQERMLSWAPGPRDYDGVWARHWYGAVWRSTGFAPYRPKRERVPDRLADLLADCRAPYEALRRHRLRPRAAGRG